MAKEAVLETVTMIYGEDQILRITINNGAEIGLEQVRLQFETIRRLCGDNRIPVLVDARCDHQITREAKEFAADSDSNRIATAVVTSNPLASLFINFFIRVFKPQSRYKSFFSFADAEDWLKQQVLDEQRTTVTIQHE